MSLCKYCSRPSVTALSAGELPVCEWHYVDHVDVECLRASLLGDIDEFGRIVECREIQLAVKKTHPKLYEQLSEYFAV